MVLKFFLIQMVLFAVIAIQVHKLRRAVIYLGVFSLISSFCFLLYSAPDVAIAEAIIGSTLGTILYLVALQKHRVFTIYYTDENSLSVDDGYINRGRVRILNLVEKHCVSKELEPQVIYTMEKLKDIQDNHEYDLIIRQNTDGTFVYGNRENYQLDSLKKYIHRKGYKKISFIMNNDL